MPPKKKAPRVKAAKPVMTDVPKLPLADGAVRLMPESDGSVPPTMYLRTANDAGSSVINVSTGRGSQTAQHIKLRDEYVLKLELKSSQCFSFTPMMISSGILKGRQILVLQPDQTPTTSVSLLDLPPEVRNIIYCALLVKPGQDPCYVRGKQFKHLRCLGPESFGLFRTSRQVYQEAATVYYGFNKFNFTDTTTLLHYLTRIGSSTKFLRHVEVDGITKATAAKAGKLLAAATRLECLRLCPRDLYIDTDFLVHAFLPLFDALQTVHNNREKVFAIVRAHSADKICQGYCFEDSGFWLPSPCTCMTTEEFMDRMERSFSYRVADRYEERSPIPEPESVNPSAKDADSQNTKSGSDAAFSNFD
ncbi:hypothetical protein MBLNU459_g0378t1 [Dothideomycetes sp. NU459]